MSASREKKIRQDQTSTGWKDPRTAHEAAARKADKRSNIMYTVIAVLFVLAAIAAIVWRSNIIPKTATAATIDGQDYKVSEVNFYYQNTLRGFLGNNYQMMGVLGINMNEPLDKQKVSDGAAAMLGIEPNGTWKDYLMGETLKQMASIQAALKAAEEEGFTYPDSVQTEYDASMESLKTSAMASNVSVNKYLQGNLGRTMTEKVYGEQLMRMLKYSAYTGTYYDGLTYTDDEIDAAYKADVNSFDKVHYEIVNISAVPETKTDEDGKPVQPTEEEINAAKAAAKTAAEKMQASWKSGSDLETLADADENATYSDVERASYAKDNAVSEWLFDASRMNGDSIVMENGGSMALMVFHSRGRETKNTVDVRHILIQPEAGTLTEKDEGYADEQAKLKADAKAKADEILATWKSGEATEDSFAALAKENSADGNAAEGGIYEQVYQGMMLPTFDEWCFADGRKPGDTGVVETEYGYHVMYFVGTDIPKWKVDVTNSLKDAAYEEWADQFGADYTTEIHSLGAKFVA